MIQTGVLRAGCYAQISSFYSMQVSITTFVVVIHRLHEIIGCACYSLTLYIIGTRPLPFVPPGQGGEGAYVPIIYVKQSNNGEELYLISYHRSFHQ